ncbi:hypothetical protein M7I_7580 [Glarea lozoyensis 74030]|uniref:Uncharacterized protein n=1 Tax=Glarea lozoyensis (strain ATCC 74030 / MF5533) TaxID=1104152 RepID=H0EXP1_GLAL7|nr:hypothetical protein M7I_7580 [Glarea lozoyensis 74030]
MAGLLGGVTKNLDDTLTGGEEQKGQGGLLGGVTNTVGQTVDGAGKTVSGTVDGVGKTAGGATSGVTKTVGGVADQAGGAAGVPINEAFTLGSRADQRAQRYPQSQFSVKIKEILQHLIRDFNSA